MAAMAGRDGTLTLCDEDLSLATDLYQLTMAATYHRRRPMPRASYELFVRCLPAERNFLVFAGLEQALASLVRIRFSRRQIDYLRGLAPFRSVGDDFFRTLADFRFRGNVWAVREGTVFFPGEPLLRVTGSLLEAQLVETLLLSIINFQIVISSKAARIRLAAGEGVELAEFGGRRAHGPQAAAWVARCAYLAGFDSTSNVLAGEKLGLPVVGTMAHSFIMSFDQELEAFEQYRRVFPEHTILLVDTYDTLEGVRRALALGQPFAGIRLDSGDIALLAVESRRLLDAAGRQDAKIFVSGDMNEQKIARLLAAGAPIDAFGVGTQLATSADSPYVGGIYKLVEIEEGGRVVPKFKASVGKVTYPGKKQVLRRVERGEMRGDRIVALSEAKGLRPSEEPL
ncbi:MAG: nicotinate phosphoribosyltransferase, partial [Thermoanaerobaculia bacterium]